MVNAREVKQKIGTPDYRNTIGKNNAFNRDIVSELHKNIIRGIEEAKPIAHLFKGETKTQTAENIWNYLKQNVKYEKDSEQSQDVRTPKRFVHDAIGDCKSYGLFTHSILKSLGDDDARLRYTSYDSFPTPRHVYCVTKDENGNELVIDGVWKRFNDQKKYTYKKDYKMKTRTLSGFDRRQQGVGSLKDLLNKVGTAVKNVVSNVKTEVKAVTNVVQTTASNIKSGLQQAAQAIKTGGVKTVALAIPRSAFLGLVAINFRALARRISTAFKNDSKRISDKWSALGGQPSELKRVADANAAKSATFGSPVISGTNGMGDAVTTLTAVATSAPVLIEIINLLKSMGLGDNSDVQVSTEAAQGFKAETGVDIPVTLSNASSQTTSSNQATSTTTPPTNWTPLLWGAAGLGLLFIATKKSK